MKKKAPSFKKEAYSFFKYVTPYKFIFVFDRKRIEKKEVVTQTTSAGHHEKKSIGALFQSEDST